MHSARKTMEDLLTFVRTSKMPLLEPLPAAQRGMENQSIIKNSI